MTTVTTPLVVPKIIHQIWYQGQDLIPRDLKKKSEKIKKKHPTWQYILWDNDRIQTYFKSDKVILDTYNKLEFLHQKVDFIRYCIIYNFGGVYLDMDITILKPIDNVINKIHHNNSNQPDIECTLSYLKLNSIESYICCGYSKCINNAVIIANPQSNFINTLINEIIQNKGLGKWYEPTDSFRINRTTGPMMVTKMYNMYLQKKQKKRVNILHWSYFEPCTLGDLCDIKSNTVAIHHHHTTWISKNITNLVYYYFKYKTTIVVMVVGLLMTILTYVIYKSVNVTEN
jgi:mannosyltransferase OCH1-like enzyme